MQPSSTSLASSHAVGETPARLEVALAMLTLVPGAMGGTETYARELVRHLGRSTKVKATGFVSQAGAGFCDSIDEHVIHAVTGGPGAVDRIRTLAQAAAHRRSILDQMEEHHVIHAPFTVPAPRPRARTPFVQTLHDVQHLELPHLFSRAERLYRTRTYEGAARTADAVVTISDFARRQIIEHIGLEPVRVFVAPLGVDADAYTPHVGPREPFVFYPARGWPHKNHARLIEAVALMRERDPRLRLVLTGGALDSLGATPDWVDVRGLVPLVELRELYRSASALVFPSLYEGFGLPPLEAMASGCPVAVSTAGSLPEICGDAAVLFDPEDPAAIAAAGWEAIDRCAELQPLGLARVRQYTWEACAQAHEAAYQFAACESRP
ncbi:glycosyltransferase family 4 protein [Cellulomonas chengniuliangii]|uniref:Glycosyltransferase family 4 protein n=1 Tax=Cellulomonas chengniuliangii TaxID=2968084 RepID=A0ABY5KVM0_9CELL|nr:glycosyltransferase family 1 protein [Cellulomonas chengniuliangii]MCC2308739.1 glycosyltransferase family 4 protein [Cellulomonas chengniuliangii]UUI74510.1 glycosyltransferase family 4 protein [Cellulomonas chengniuliangii]